MISHGFQVFLPDFPRLRRAEPRSGAGYTDTGTPGLVLPSVLLDEILTELRRKILADEMRRGGEGVVSSMVVERRWNGGLVVVEW